MKVFNTRVFNLLSLGSRYILEYLLCNNGQDSLHIFLLHWAWHWALSAEGAGGTLSEYETLLSDWCAVLIFLLMLHGGSAVQECGYIQWWHNSIICPLYAQTEQFDGLGIDMVNIFSGPPDANTIKTKPWTCRVTLPLLFCISTHQPWPLGS